MPVFQNLIVAFKVIRSGCSLLCENILKVAWFLVFCFNIKPMVYMYTTPFTYFMVASTGIVWILGEPGEISVLRFNWDLILPFSGYHFLDWVRLFVLYAMLHGSFHNSPVGKVLLLGGWVPLIGHHYTLIQRLFGGTAKPQSHTMWLGS